MADSNAIFEAGQTLVELLRRGLTPQPVTGPEHIGLCAPHEPEDFQITVWIYNLETIKTGMAQGFLPDPENPSIERYVPLQLRLHVLVSAHSKAPAQTRLTDEYRMLGRAIQLIYDTPEIRNDVVNGSLLNTPLKLEYQNLNSDELSKIWNATGKPPKPSFGVQITPITISSGRTRPTGKRVGSATVSLSQI